MYKQTDLKDALDKSSSHNSRLILLFLLFLVYTLVIVASTTDLQLLIPESKVRLPIVNVELPLFGFYIVAPFLIVIFHFNLLFNLLQHSKKLYEWDKKRNGGDKVLLYPFMFNYLIQYREKNIQHYFLKRSIWIVVYSFSLAILLFIQLRFSAYHSLLMTFYHSLLIVADCFLLFIYWHRITRPELLTREYDSFKAMRMWHFHRKKWWGSLVFLAILISLGNLIILLLVKQVDTKYLTYIKPVIPRLVLMEKTLVALPPSDAIIQRYLAMGKSEDDAWADFTKGLNLRGRDLKFAVFMNSNLQKADLIEAKLQGALLLGARLQGANLGKAQLQGAYLGGAQLQGAYLSEAQLQGANFFGARLQGTNLSGAQLQLAFLSQAELQGVNLYRANLQGAILNNTHLEGANLREALLKGTNLDSTELQGADLSYARLQGVDLEGANLQGANLSKAQLQGTDLSGAYLYCTDLNGANLEGLLFEDIRIDTKTEVNWDDLLEKISPLIPKGKVVDETDPPVSFFPAYEYRLKDIFSKNINNAKQRCKDFKKEALSALHSDYNKFIEVRTNLACEDFHIAKRILRLKPDDLSFYKGVIMWISIETERHHKVKKEIIAHMQSQCPENLKRLKLTENIKEK
ncbi:MAG: pentapeptide repeat-containing protein [Nitrospirota bacterium]